MNSESYGILLKKLLPWYVLLLIISYGLLLSLPEVGNYFSVRIENILTIILKVGLVSLPFMWLSVRNIQKKEFKKGFVFITVFKAIILMVLSMICVNYLI